MVAMGVAIRGSLAVLAILPCPSEIPTTIPFHSARNHDGLPGSFTVIEGTHQKSEWFGLIDRLIQELLGSVIGMHGLGFHVVRRWDYSFVV